MHTKIHVTTRGLLKLIYNCVNFCLIPFSFILSCVFKEAFSITISLLFRIHGFFGAQYIPVMNKINGS